MPGYKRTPQELRSVASMFWPPELSQQEAEISVIPKLLETQEQFVAILSVPIPEIGNLFEIVAQSSLPWNLFLKHLVVLSDLSGETLQRVNREFGSLFPQKKLCYVWKGSSYVYDFRDLPIDGSLTNAKLGISGKKLLANTSRSDLATDVVMLALFGALASDDGVAALLQKCDVGTFIGHPPELDKFVKQRYIQVSRITQGAQANQLGQIAQRFVREYLAGCVGTGVSIVPNGHVPGVSHSEPGSPNTTFDLVVSRGQRYVAVEISFQVTTNSTIERKSGQAQSRYAQIHGQNNRIAYVLDGAGNFQRVQALGRLCQYSDCTVAFSKEELEILCQFIKEFLSL